MTQGAGEDSSVLVIPIPHACSGRRSGLSLPWGAPKVLDGMKSGTLKLGWGEAMLRRGQGASGAVQEGFLEEEPHMRV